MKIVVLDRLALGSDIPLDALTELGAVTIYDASTSEEAVERSRDADIIILNKIKITEETMISAKHLKLICVTATGYDNIDISAAKRYGIGVTNVPGYSTNSVTIFTIATVLSLTTKIREYNEHVVSGEYENRGVPNRLEPVYHEMLRKTWGIVGYGNIGRSVSRVAEALGARVLVYKRTPTEEADCVDFESLCRESDIITVHCPLNPESRELICEKTISLMKDGVIIVNEARGAVVNENDITNAVLSGKIGAYGSDVYTIEPFGKDHPFAKIMGLPNVLLTPHAAWGAYEARKRCIDIVVSNISAFVRGNIQNRVDI